MIILDDKHQKKVQSVSSILKSSMASSQKMQEQTDFILTDKDFDFISKFVYKHVGIVLQQEKRAMVYARLTRRLRSLNLPSFSAYCSLLEKDSKQEEIPNLINAITTNLTRFFRENHHFDHLQTDVIEAKFGKINKSDVFKSQSNQQSQYTQTKKFHVWSAGCSTGEEPYSLAMTLLEATNGGVGWDLSILASDVDTNVLNTAKQGIYKDSSSIPSHMLSRYTEKMTDESFKMKQNVQKIIQFQHINFLSDWPIRQTFDAIFCRNVVIYFDKETQTRIFNHMADLLTPNGWLYIGHSESLYKICDRFKLMGRTIYQKNG